MRQRVAIARTLILKPRIILMDEPFGALDPVTRHNMQDLLVNLWREVQATVFFVTHDVTEAVYLGDRVLYPVQFPGGLFSTACGWPRRTARPASCSGNRRSRIPCLPSGTSWTPLKKAKIDMVKKASLWTYLKAAFSWRWNLLGVGAAVVFSFLSGLPDVVLPLVGAVELAYLGLLSTNPRFRKSVDARGLTSASLAQRGPTVATDTG